MINDVKSVTGILCLFLPIPIFWALFDQQGSRWTLQASKMNGQLFGSWYIQPDQIQVINPVLIVLMIPLFESIIYPILSKIKICQKPLQRMTVGGVLAALSFIVAAIIQQMIESSEPIVATNDQFSITLINGNSRCNSSYSMSIEYGPEGGPKMVKPLPNFLRASHFIADGQFSQLGQSGQVTLTASNDQLGNSVVSGGDECYFTQKTLTYRRGQSVLLYLDTRGHLIEVLPEQFKYSRPEGQVASVLAIFDTGKCVAGQINTCVNNQNYSSGASVNADGGGSGGDDDVTSGTDGGRLGKFIQLNSDRHRYNFSISNALPVSNGSMVHQSDGKMSSIIQLDSPKGPYRVASNELHLQIEDELSFGPGSLNVLVIDCCKVGTGDV